MSYPELRFKDNGPNAMIIRHAERFHVPNVSSIADSLRVGLTEKGMMDAREMGRSIEGIDRLRLFHSPAVRCKQTAQAIAEGFTECGGEVEGFKETWDLCAPYLLDSIVLKEADRLGHAFMRSWFDGKFDPEWILPTSVSADMVLGPIIAGLREDGPAGRMDIHVSHDWEIVLLRDELFGTRYEEEGWVDYLDGIAISPCDGGFRAVTSKATAEFTFPRSPKAAALR